MAIPRGSLVLNLSLVTILLCFFILVATANSDYDDEIHAVRHCSPTADGKAGEKSNKGDPCREENYDVDEDFDDTYKIVNNVKITLPASGRILEEAATTVDDILGSEASSEEVVGSLYVMGH